MEEAFYVLTPKRKSILWQYRENGSALVIAVKNERLEQLQGIFKNELPKNDVNDNDGYGIAFNQVGTKIWERCDGINTVREIIHELKKIYNVEEEELSKDIKEFMEYCQEMEILEMNWRCLL